MINNIIGVVMAGGQGTRLRPLTSVINKHLLPVYQKPMIYYSLTNLVLAGVKEIMIVVNPHDKIQFQTLLDPLFKDSKVTLNYLVQEKADGIAGFYNLVKPFVDGKDLLLHLGDNLFFGHDFIGRIQNMIESDCSSLVSYDVRNPHAFGVIEFNGDSVINIVEKPSIPVSNSIATGLYFYKNKDLRFFGDLIASARGELEITDFNNRVVQDSNLNVLKLARGDLWFDCGSFDDLLDAGQFIKFIESRHPVEIGDLEGVLKSIVGEKK